MRATICRTLEKESDRPVTRFQRATPAQSAAAFIIFTAIAIWAVVFDCFPF